MNVEQLFPKLTGTDYQLTSPTDLTYNCVAWAMGESDRWWWPDFLDVSYWPEGCRRSESINAFLEMIRLFGYFATTDETCETNVERVALFSKAHKPTHMARQLSSGLWTSKLGSGIDLTHPLHALEGAEYGTVHSLFRRPN